MKTARILLALLTAAALATAAAGTPPTTTPAPKAAPATPVLSPAAAAQIFIRQNLFPQARTALLKAIDQQPNRLDLHFELGLVELRLNDPNAAAFEFAAASQAFGNRFDLNYNQAVSLAQAGKFKDAASVLQKAVTKATVPENLKAQVYSVLGDLQYEAKDYAGAVKTFKQLYSLTQKPTDLYKVLLARFKNGERASLVVPLKELRATVGHPASQLLARIYMDQNMPAYAERELQDARKRAVKALDMEALANDSLELANVYAQQQKYDQAISVLSELDKSYQTQNVHIALAQLNLLAGKPDKALQELKAIPASASKANVMPDTLRTIAYVAAGNFKDAVNAGNDLMQEINTAVSAYANLPYGGVALTNLAYADQQVGHSSAAVGVLAKLSPDSLHMPELLLAGKVFYQNGDYENAIKYFSAAASNANATTDQATAALRDLADTYLAAKHFDGAIVTYQQLLALAPYDTAAVYDYGWALIGAQRVDEGKTQLQHAADRGYQPASKDLKTYFPKGK